MYEHIKLTFYTINDLILKKAKNNMSNTFNNNLNRSNISNFANQVNDNASQQFNQKSEETQTLAQAAEEIQNLLKALEKTNPTANQAEREAFVNTAIHQDKKNKIIRALKAGGEKALEEFLKNPYVNVGMAIVKEWQEVE